DLESCRELLAEVIPRIVRVQFHVIEVVAHRFQRFGGRTQRIFVGRHLHSLDAQLALDLFQGFTGFVWRNRLNILGSEIQETHARFSLASGPRRAFFAKSCLKCANSASVRYRQSPGFSFGSSRKPMLTRRSFSTGWPMA